MNTTSLQSNSPISVNTEPVLCLLGPTASGKTAAALALAEHYPIEIISLDSALVYRDMNIGTAKPSAAEQAAVIHHLIDIIDPAANYSAAQFREDALRLIEQIRASGKRPLIVGGTMLYYKALRHGLSNLPLADPVVRTQLDEQALAVGWPAMHARLATVDPISAERLEPNDSQRIQRALEIYELTGKPMSHWFAEQEHSQSTNDLPTLIPIALEPTDRKVLHDRIALRFRQMLNEGLIEEVEKLKSRPDLHLNLPSMRCVGYRQTWEYLDGFYDQSALLEKGIAATRQLAKRQLTWLRSTPERMVLDCHNPRVIEQMLQLVKPYWA